MPRGFDLILWIFGKGDIHHSSTSRRWHHSLLATEGTSAVAVATATSAGAEVDSDGTKPTEDDELSIEAPAICCGGRPAARDCPLPGSLSTEGYVTWLIGVSAAAADKLTSEAATDLGTLVLSPGGISNSAGIERGAWASGTVSVTERVPCGSGAEVTMPLGACGASAAGGRAAASAALALLSISSNRRWTIRGISCT